MKDERGFTLLETLAAFAILAASLVAMYGVIGTGIDGLNAAARVDEAVLRAQSRLDSILATRELPEPRTGTFEGGTFAWRIDETVPAKRSSDGTMEIIALRLTVSWKEAGRARAIAVDRMMVRPARGAPPAGASP